MSDSVQLASIHQSSVIAPASRGIGWGWLVAIAVAIVYGSFIPFELDISVFTPAAAYGLLRLGLHAAGPGDVATNLALYIPLGCAFVLCAKRRSERLPASCVVLAIVTGTGLSLLVEVVQTGMPSRVGSWLDVLLNGSGTAIGALVGVSLMCVSASRVTSLRDRLAGTPFTLASSALTLGLLLYYLLPFDFITDTSGLRAAFVRSLWDPGVAQPPSAGWLSGHSGGPPCYTVAAQRLVAALWFAALGYCLALSRWEAGERRLTALGSAIERGWVLAVVAHLMTLFIASRVFDVVALWMTLPAVLLGASCALFTMGALKRPSWKRHPSVTVPTLLLCSLAVLQVLAMVMGSTGTQASTTGGVDLHGATLLPFEAMWHLPVTLAARAALSLCVTYGALAGTLALMLQRADVRAPWLASGALSAAVALALHSTAQSATADLDFTAPILAGASALVLAGLHRVSRPLPT